MAGGMKRTPGSRSGAPARSSTARRDLRTLVVLAALLAVAAVCVAVVPMLAGDNEDASAATAQPLLAVSADEITTITWTYQDVQSQVSYEDDTWVDTAGGEELDQDAVRQLTDALADATTSRTIDAADEVEDMGLGDPQVTIELTCSDASSISLDVGSETSDGTAYYVQRDGDGSIELVDAEAVQAFFCDLTNLYEMEDAPQSYSATGLTLVSDAGMLTLSYYEDGLDASYSDSYTWYADDDSGTGQQPVDASEAEALVYDVNYLTWVACVDPSYDGSVDYGFDDPTLVATLSYVTESTENVGDTNDDGYDDYETVETPGTFTLVVGHEKEGSLAYYAQPEGSSKVYTISSSTVEDLLAASIDDMLPDDVLLMDWTTVESIDATADGVTKTIELTHEETQTDEDGDGEPDIETTYTVDGSEADADDVEDLLDALDGLAAEGEADGAAAGEAQVTLVFHRSTETYAEVTLAFSRYDNSFYLVTLDGTSRLLVNRNDVESIAELIGAL